MVTIQKLETSKLIRNRCMRFTMQNAIIPDSEWAKKPTFMSFHTKKGSFFKNI